MLCLRVEPLRHIDSVATDSYHHDNQLVAETSDKTTYIHGCTHSAPHVSRYLVRLFSTTPPWYVRRMTSAIVSFLRFAVKHLGKQCYAPLNADILEVRNSVWQDTIQTGEDLLKKSGFVTS